MAAVDLGSNSFHMMVARSTGDGELQVVDRLREPVRLAAGLDSEKRLAPDAQERALDCLRRFGQRLKNLPPEQVRAVGTNTLRELKRGREFVAAAEEAIGHSIEIIAGVEEARLVYGGVTHGMGQEAPRRLVVDIGGGSTELIIGKLGTPKLMESVSLGCVVHTKSFFDDGKITKKRFDAARLAARLELEFLERSYQKAGWDTVLGASGSVRGIWRVMRAQGWSQDSVTRSGLDQTVEMVLKTGHVSKINYEGLREDRRPVFVGGLAVLCGIFDALDLQEMHTSERALREGLIYDLLGRMKNIDVRSENVRGFAHRFGVDAEHAEDVEKIALAALAQVADDWKLDLKHSKQLLSWAAHLHEIGLSVSHSSYHKHGDYLLRNADLHGFSITEQKLLAALVRLHRGKFAASVLEDLPRPWQEPVRKLAIILRFAYLVQRSRTPDLSPSFKIKAARRGMNVEFKGDWLDTHPLTNADLEREQKLLAASGFKFNFE